jgi:hypothetical protein
MRGLRAPIFALVALWSAAPVAAGTFEVKSPEVTKGETELSANSAFQSGFPANAERVRQSWEIALGYGFTDWLRASLKGNLDLPVGGDMQLSTAGIETQLYAGRFAPAISWGWFTELAFGVHRGETNTVVFGPLIQFGDDKQSLTLNALFEQTFGQNREEGLAFTYAAGLKWQVREGLAVGVESHGSIPNIGDWPGVAFQEHRIGPVLYLELPAPWAGAKHKLSVEIGAFAGLTEATPDATGKLKASLTW